MVLRVAQVQAVVALLYPQNRLREAAPNLLPAGAGSTEPGTDMGKMRAPPEASFP